MKTIRLSLGLALFCAASVGFAQSNTPMYTLERSQKDFFKVKVTLPKFGNSKVQKVATNEYKKEANKWLDEFMASAKDAREHMLPGQPYELTISTMVSVNKPNVVSGYMTIFMQTGGAHPNTMFRALNFGLKNGIPRQIHISDLLAENVTKPMLLDKVVLPTLNKVKQARGAEIATEVDPALMDSFIITQGGIAWLFEPYTAGPYSDGYFVAKVMNPELKEWIKPSNPLQP